MKSVLMFPGQAELKIETVSAILETETGKKLLAEVERATDFDWPSLRLGSSYLLNKTKNAQLLQFLCSLVLSEQLSTYPYFFNPDFVVGHSLGEYTALHFSGAYSLGTTAKLIAKRVSLLETVTNGRMAWVLASEDKVSELTEQIPNVAVAAINGPESVTIAGTDPDFGLMVRYLKEVGLKVKVLGSVGVLSHSPLLKEQARLLADSLHKAEFLKLHHRVIGANSAAEITKFTGMEIAYYLRRQLVTPVLWLKTVQHLWEEEGVRRFVECGAAPFLGKLVERIYPEAEVVVIDSLDKVAVLKA